MEQQEETRLLNSIRLRFKAIRVKRQRTHQRLQEFLIEFLQIDQDLIKNFEKELIGELSSLQPYIDELDFVNCGNYLLLLNWVLTPLVPLPSLSTFLFVKNATQHILTTPEAKLPDAEANMITDWLEVYSNFIRLITIIIIPSNSQANERIELISEGDYMGFFIECLTQLAKVFSFKNWNAVDNEVKSNYEREFVACIENIIAKATILEAPFLLLNFSSLADVMTNLLMKLDFGEIHAAKTISILNAGFYLFQSCFDETHLKKFNVNSNEYWKTIYAKKLVANLPPFFDCFQHENAEVRLIVAKLCKLITVNCPKLEVQSLVFATIVQLLEDHDETVKMVVEEAKHSVYVTVAESSTDSMERFSLNVLRGCLRLLSVIDVQDVKDLRTAVRYIGGLFNFTKNYASLILSYETEISCMLRSFYRIIEMEESEMPKLSQLICQLDAFLHFGNISKSSSYLCISFAFKSVADDIEFIFDNIVAWIVILVLSDLDAKRDGIIHKMINGEFFEIRESFFILVNTLQALLAPIGKGEPCLWANSPCLRHNLETDLRQCLGNLNKVLENQLPAVTHEESESIERIEPSVKNLEMTCLALRGIHLIVQILGYNHLLEIEQMQTITQNVLLKCRDIHFLISLSARHCLQQIAIYWLENLKIDFYERKSFIFIDVDCLANFEDFKRLREKPPVGESGERLIRKTLMFFRQFSSVTFCMENENWYWKMAHNFLLSYLKSEIKFINELESYRDYKRTYGYNLFLEVLSTYGNRIELVGISNKEIKHLAVELIPCLSSGQSKTTNSLAMKMYVALHKVNKNLVLKVIHQLMKTAAPTDDYKFKLETVYNILTED